MTPTNQQKAIYDFVQKGRGHAVIEAYAGTGKTTTIVQAAQGAPKGSIFVAFNKSIASELAARLPGVQCSTLHSLGLRTITANQGRRPIDGDAAKARIKALAPSWNHESRFTVLRIVSRAKCTPGVPSLAALADIADQIGVDACDADIELASRVLTETLADTIGPIDFDDMCWLPASLPMRFSRAPIIFVDETQDMNPVQLAIVKRVAGVGAKGVKPGRIIAIGDRHQSIYGFRGADPSAIPHMIEDLEAKVLPLTTTWRCGKAIVAEVDQSLVPGFAAPEHAHEGAVRYAAALDAVDGDMVVARVNAPLITNCYRYLSSGHKATVRGRDIGADLAQWFTKHASGLDATETERAIAEWQRREVAKAEAAERDPMPKIEKADCLRAILEGASDANSAAELCLRIFSDDRAGVQFSSTHRAKGLEASRVWLLRDTYLRSDSVEERNLLYVAQTRAKHELVYTSAA